jgi:hypothetical protein
VQNSVKLFSFCFIIRLENANGNHWRTKSGKTTGDTFVSAAQSENCSAPTGSKSSHCRSQGVAAEAQSSLHAGNIR